MGRHKTKSVRSKRMRGSTRSLAVRSAEADEKAGLLKMRVEKEIMESDIRRARIKLQRRRRP